MLRVHHMFSSCKHRYTDGHRHQPTHAQCLSTSQKCCYNTWGINITAYARSRAVAGHVVAAAAAIADDDDNVACFCNAKFCFAGNHKQFLFASVLGFCAQMLYE